MTNLTDNVKILDVISNVNNKLDISSYVVDSALSSASENPVQNKVLYPSLSGFIPAGTTITVKTDGTGDFTNLQSAISYLTGKWSNGQVTISIAAGTYAPTGQIVLNGSLCSIPYLLITGVSEASTIFNFSSMYVGAFNIIYWSTKLTLLKFTINCAGRTLTPGRGVNIQESSGFVAVSNITVNHSDAGICTLSNSSSHVANCTMHDCNIGMWQATGARVCAISDKFTNINGNAVQLYKGATVSLDGTATFTSVNSQYSQSRNTVTENGIIMGSW